MADIKKILAERGSTYGNYLEQATISRTIANAVYNRWIARGFGTSNDPEDYPSVLLADQVDAVNMIAVKLSRIANGDPHYADSWRDIAGYATLVADRIEGMNEKPEMPKFVAEDSWPTDPYEVQPSDNVSFVSK